MRAPISFSTQNLVWGGGRADPWALYRIEMESYEGLSVNEKLELLGSLAGWAHGVEHDFTLLRVNRAWSPAEYRSRAESGLDPRWGFADQYAAWLAGHEQRLGLAERVRPELYLSVSLAAPGRGLGHALAAGSKDP